MVPGIARFTPYNCLGLERGRLDHLRDYTHGMKHSGYDIRGIRYLALATSNNILWLPSRCKAPPRRLERDCV